MVASALDSGRALPRMLSNTAGLFAALARSSDGGRVVELDGVRASVVPACPARSTSTASCTRTPQSSSATWGASPTSTSVPASLGEARERGCTTGSLQATARGRPVYERLGFRPLGALHMWERRRARS